MPSLTPISKKITTLLSIVKHFGLIDTAYFLLHRTLNVFTSFRQFEVLTLSPDTAATSFLELPDGYSGSFVAKHDLMSFIEEFSKLDLGHDFVCEAYDRGDKCYGIFFEGQLVSYGWYSQQATPIDSELLFNFSHQYTYMYRGFTVPEFRGKRLHALGMSRALTEFVAEGSRGFVSYVERQNFASLRSVYRSRYEKQGSIYVLKFSGRYTIWCPRALHTVATIERVRE